MEAIADADAGNDGSAKDYREHHKGRAVAIRGVCRGFFGADVIEIDVLLQDLVGRERDLVDRLGIQFMCLVRNLSGGLA
jgi:hypothetical protein